MQLQYKLLWFEDNISSFNAKKEFVKEIVEELGFSFAEPRHEIDGANIDAIDYDDFDLIVADLKLSGTDGPSLITKIRKLQVYTEVLFYSSEGEQAVREALSKFKIDGAYCAGREPVEFEDKIKRVIQTTVKKVQDLNNIRGLIMAETSDLDGLMQEIIEATVAQNIKDLKDDLCAHIFKNVESKVNDKKENFDRYKRNNNIKRILKDHVMFDTSERIKSLQYIIDRLEHVSILNLKNNAFQNNHEELNKKRILLAHVKEVVLNGEKHLKSGVSEFHFSDQNCVALRKEISKQQKSLKDIQAILDSPN